MAELSGGEQGHVDDKSATPAVDPSLLDLPAILDDYLTGNYSPSGIVAVARHGDVLSSHAWGDDGYDLRTPFRIASCTKSFTALALLILRREGRLGLDDAVAEHLTELKVEAPADWPTLRIRHLLSMSAGLATDNPWGDRQESISRERLSTWMSGGLRLIFAPGSSFEYSNLGYALLGEVITRLSGQDYRDFVRERIIDPLGLGDTRFAASDLESVAQGHHREPALVGQPGGWTDQEASGPGAFSPIGGLYSSVSDLVAWANLYLSRSVPEGASFTAADLLEAQQPLNPFYAGPAAAPLRGHSSLAYGYGLFIETLSDHGTIVSHSGGYPGFTSFMCWHKESGYTVISSANGTHSGAQAPAERVLLPLVASAKNSGRNGAVDGASTSGSGDTPDTWPETRVAAVRIEELVRAVSTSRHEELAAEYADVFAENVEMDFPVVRRLKYLQEALVNLGRLRPAEEVKKPSFKQPSTASWSIPAEYGRLELYIELAPVAPFAVQTFAAEMVNGHRKVKLF